MKALRRQFGRGPEVSPFTLGTMRALGSAEQMYKVVKASLSAGINHLETAPSYGPAESFLGNALKRLKEQGLEPEGGWVITSKILPKTDIKKAKLQLNYAPKVELEDGINRFLNWAKDNYSNKI